MVGDEDDEPNRYDLAAESADWLQRVRAMKYPDEFLEIANHPSGTPPGASYRRVDTGKVVRPEDIRDHIRTGHWKRIEERDREGYHVTTDTSERFALVPVESER